MHGVAEAAALGGTVDEYRARFRLRYRNNHRLPRGRSPIERVVAGERFRDVVVEVTPPGAGEPRWVHQVRSLVLTDEDGEPDCLVLILHDVTERFAAEERFESSFNVNPAPAVICRLADRLFVKVNRGFLELTSLDRDEVIGRSLEELDVLAGVADPDPVRASVLRGEPLGQTEAQLPLASGGVKAVIVAGQPIELDGRACMMFTFMDLDPRHAAEQALAESRTRSVADYEALYTQTPVPLHSLDADRCIVSVSDRWLDLLGYEREAVIGRPITEFMPPELADTLRRDWERLLAEGVVHDRPYRFLTSSGGLVDVLLSARVARDADGRVLRTMAVLVDVTERRHSERRFTQAFELAPVPMLVMAMDDHRILSANQAFLTCIGRPAEAVLGRDADQLRLWEDRRARITFLVLLERDGSVRNLDARIVSVGGEVMDCLLSADVVSIHGDRRALVALLDISDRRRSEAQLFEAIETVMRDTSWFSRTVIERLMQLRQPSGRMAGAALSDLTKREAELLGVASVNVVEFAGGTGVATVRRLWV